MKNIKNFKELFESVSNKRIDLYDYLCKCFNDIGIHIFPNYDEDAFDYKENGIKSLDIVLNTHFKWGSVSYAFTEALNPNPDESILGCVPGINDASLNRRIKFDIGNSGNPSFNYMGLNDEETKEFEIDGDDNYIFSYIINHIFFDFSQYGDRFFMTYGGGKIQKFHMPEYSEFIKKYLKYLIKLKVGDPINYNIYDDIDKYFKENPLDIYKIDNLGEFKNGVIKRTGIKDYGKIGRNLRNGMI
jgi:hypothetical protein